MINSDTAKSTYTVAEGVTEYPIGFQYMWNENNQPQILVYAGPEANRYLEYGTDFTVSDDGLSIVLSAEIEAGTKLSIMSDEPFIQDSDYAIGRIDPEQIERDFDKSVLRDLQLRDYADDINDRLADEVQARTDADTALQDAIDDEVAARSLADTTLQDNIDAEADAREDADDALQAAINTKQDTIADLATIRSGAVAGATAVQPNDLASVATSGSYNDLNNRPIIPTVGDGLVTIKQGGVVKASFSVNQDTDTEVELEQGGGGGGAVDSVNGKTGAVVLDASDVGAVAKAGDTMTGPLTVAEIDFDNSLTIHKKNSSFVGWTILGDGTTVLPLQNGTHTIGGSTRRLARVYVGNLNDDLVVPNGSGTIARLEDLPTVPSDIGAATAAQGAKADTAVQPAAIANMQTTSNLVTSVSSASTDAQYPSAKLFYETCGDIESLINAL